MLIRSQDGMDLIVLDDIGIIESRTVSGAFDIESYKHDAHVVIGRYKTKESALKVLDSIQEYYCNPVNLKCRVFKMPYLEGIE